MFIMCSLFHKTILKVPWTLVPLNLNISFSLYTTPMASIA
jgi:hypothetical protein